jgi:hypothetical protein
VREYYVLQTEFWINPLYTSFSLRAQLIAMYLMGCPHTDRKEGLRTAEEYIASLLSIDKKTIRRAIQELVEANFLSPDYKQGWKLIHFFKEEGDKVSKDKRKESFTKNMAHYCKDV